MEINYIIKLRPSAIFFSFSVNFSCVVKWVATCFGLYLNYIHVKWTKSYFSMPLSLAARQYIIYYINRALELSFREKYKEGKEIYFHKRRSVCWSFLGNRKMFFCDIQLLRISYFFGESIFFLSCIFNKFTCHRHNCGW